MNHVRFQADADLNQAIVAAVIRREPAIDFRTATLARLASLSDPEVLALAADDGRILVTHDHARCRANSRRSFSRALMLI